MSKDLVEIINNIDQEELGEVALWEHNLDYDPKHGAERKDMFAGKKFGKGARVIIQGLALNNGEYNGLKGMVVGYDTELGMYTVDVEELGEVAL